MILILSLCNIIVTFCKAYNSSDVLFHYRIPEEAPEHFSEPFFSTAQIALNPENGLWDQQQDLS